MAAAMTDPPGPGRSRPPLCQVGWMRSASSISGGPPSLMPTAGQAAGIGREPVDVLEGEAGVGHRLEAGVDGQREGVDHEAPAELGPADPAEDGAVLEALRADRWPRRPAHRGGHPVDGIDRAGGLEERQPDVLALLEAHGHLLADAHVGRLAADDVGGQVDRGILGQGDVGDHVGRVEVGQPAVLVDGEPDDRGPPRDLGGLRGAAAAVGADRGGRVDEPAAVPAALDAQDAVGPRRPEPLGGQAQLRKRRHPGSPGLGPASHLPGPGQY